MLGWRKTVPSARREVPVAKPGSEDDREKRVPEDRIEALKRHAEELCGGPMEVGNLDDCPVEVEEEFWKQLVEYEEAPWTTNFERLENAGVSLPSPDSLNDEELTAKLWEIIQSLALLHVFVEETDHLSDRELYSHLWTSSLREETKALPLTAHSAHHIQMLGSGSEEDNLLYLKYYADDASRGYWQEEFPGEPIPAHEDPPFDRDRLLPKPTYDPSVGQDPN
jgi:hypothetical protein